MYWYQEPYLDEVEAPEPTEAELEADYLEMLVETAPPILWNEGFCYCEDDKLCTACYDAMVARRAA